MKIDKIIAEVLDKFNEPSMGQNNAPQGQQQVQQPRQPGDVQTLNRANQNASTVLSASKRINTTTEFPEAFRVWFSGLGYSPENPAISIMKVKTEVERIMKEMGYR